MKTHGSARGTGRMQQALSLQGLGKNLAFRPALFLPLCLSAFLFQAGFCLALEAGKAPPADKAFTVERQLFRELDSVIACLEAGQAGVPTCRDAFTALIRFSARPEFEEDERIHVIKRCASAFTDNAKNGPPQTLFDAAVRAGASLPQLEKLSDNLLFLLSYEANLPAAQAYYEHLLLPDAFPPASPDTPVTPKAPNTASAPGTPVQSAQSGQPGQPGTAPSREEEMLRTRLSTAVSLAQGIAYKDPAGALWFYEKTANLPDAQRYPALVADERAAIAAHIAYSALRKEDLTTAQRMLEALKAAPCSQNQADLLARLTAIRLQAAIDKKDSTAIAAIMEEIGQRCGPPPCGTGNDAALADALMQLTAFYCRNNEAEKAKQAFARLQTLRPSPQVFKSQVWSGQILLINLGDTTAIPATLDAFDKLIADPLPQKNTPRHQLGLIYTSSSDYLPLAGLELCQTLLKVNHIDEALGVMRKLPMLDDWKDVSDSMFTSQYLWFKEYVEELNDPRLWKQLAETANCLYRSCRAWADGKMPALEAKLLRLQNIGATSMAEDLHRDMGYMESLSGHLAQICQVMFPAASRELIDHGDLAGAEDLLQKRLELRGTSDFAWPGQEPGTMTNRLIKAYCAAGDGESALRVFRNTQGENPDLNDPEVLDTACVLIAALGGKDGQSDGKSAEDGTAGSIKATQQGLDLFTPYLEPGKLGEVQRMMLTHAIFSNYCKTGTLEQIQKLVADTRQPTENREARMWQMLMQPKYIKALVKFGKLDDAADRTLRLAPYFKGPMLQDAFPAVASLVYAYVEAGRADEIKSFYEKFIAASRDEDMLTGAAAAMTGAFCEAGRPDEVLAICESIADKKGSLTQVRMRELCTSNIIQCYAIQGRLDDSLAFYKRSTAAFNSDEVTLRIITDLCEGGRANDAAPFLESMGEGDERDKAKELIDKARSQSGAKK